MLACPVVYGLTQVCVVGTRGSFGDLSFGFVFLFSFLGGGGVFIVVVFFLLCVLPKWLGDQFHVEVLGVNGLRQVCAPMLVFFRFLAGTFSCVWLLLFYFTFFKFTVWCGVVCVFSSAVFHVKNGPTPAPSTFYPRALVQFLTPCKWKPVFFRQITWN